LILENGKISLLDEQIKKLENELVLQQASTQSALLCRAIAPI